MLVLLAGFIMMPGGAHGQIGEEEDDEEENLGIENATTMSSGLIVGTRISTSREFEESLAMVGVSAGYALRNDFDILLNLDYEAIHYPFADEQRNRLFLGVTSRRTFALNDVYSWRLGGEYTHGADLNAETALDYVSGEANIVLLREVWLPGTAELDIGIGLFFRTTRHAMPGSEGMVAMYDGIYVGLYVPFEISFRFLGHRFQLDKGVKIGFDEQVGGLKLGGAGRGPLHDFSR